ncbi:4-hydroxy-tetrahydrodipicolinate synthase [Prolixibacter sp. NT017]|uniref:4-hydroxy-tetrahydrodipicolinate synthase n=1 Tax=Prolixibacter sp. NT017 TaxID=2652390 RepID=UPI00126B5EAA|nr:4-hydroxy-tetrahydrodipicolinate synthase [Prolixibacter sp. NT017]GET25190.1 4-hydroxy-tetrahydrodipicolinate synthase [Prolixibacter sp. NT017]
MGQKFRGAGVALITPFKKDSTIDFDALGELVEDMISGGIDFLVVLGTTAETATLTAEEKKSVVDFVAEKNAGRLPIVVGAGGNNTSEVVAGLKDIDAGKVDGILSVVPYYSKPTQEGIYRHFMQIAENSPVPVILYNVPGRTGVHMDAATTIRLAEASDKFVAVKEASGDLNELAIILRDRPENFSVLSGDDGLTVPAISLGANGVISVIANGFPGKVADMVHAAVNGDFRKASAQHMQFLNLFNLLFVEGNPGGIKAALNVKGKVENVLRLPLAPIGEIIYREITEEMKKING